MHGFCIQPKRPLDFALKIESWGRITCSLPSMWGPRIGDHRCTRSAITGLTTCTYIGITRKTNIEHTISDMQHRVTVDLENMGRWAPTTGPHYMLIAHNTNIHLLPNRKLLRQCFDANITCGWSSAGAGYTTKGSQAYDACSTRSQESRS